jgi:hypothetical protein
MRAGPARDTLFASLVQIAEATMVCLASCLGSALLGTIAGFAAATLFSAAVKDVGDKNPPGG